VRGAIVIGAGRGEEGAVSCGCVVHTPAIISSASCSGCIVRGSDDCFAQIAGTYLNEERTGGGAPLVEGYSRRRVCCVYRVSNWLYSFTDLMTTLSQPKLDEERIIAGNWQF